MGKASNSMNCIAVLTKEDETKFLYELTWKDGKFIAEYVLPFRASQENIDTFNRGAREVARRLRIYVETDDLSKVPNHPPAFEHLSYET